jgi:hypothetical protein
MIENYKKRKFLILFIFLLLLTIFLVSRSYKRYSLQQIITLVERTADISFKPEPKIIFLSDKEFAGKIEEIIRRDLEKTKLKREVFLLHILGLVDKDINLYKIKKSLYNKNVAGFFDEEGKKNEIFIKGKKPSYYNKIKAMLLFHELWHIIQKQKYKIDEIIPDRIEYDDKSLAILSFLEGDAIIHMEKIANFNLFIDNPEITIEDAVNLSSDENIKTYPRIIREQLIFPYVYGPRFIKYIRGKYGENYNIIYKTPPKTTLEIIFPELYPLETVKNDNSINSKEYYLSGSMGVFFINLLLKEKRVLNKYDFDLFKEWKGDYYRITVNKKNYYKFYWEIFISGDKINKITVLLKKAFPKARIYKVSNCIKFYMEG